MSPQLRALCFSAVLLQLAERTGQHANTTSGNRHTIDLYRVSQLEHMLQVTYMENISSDEMAKRLYISSRQLDRIMHQRFGMTWRQAVIEKRIEAAARLLRETTLPVSRIGTQVGFGSVSVFYREFMRRHRMSPSRYRKTQV